ncbi:MAG: dockerin type I repeat-containing protein, partial [Bacteroidaceae bacterium]|nr:dockerin type I repeat-containing protein [Bacteroidaceae bacterium]
TTPTTEASHWQLIRYNQLVSRLSTATPQNPIDASFYMTNARVRRGWPKAISGTDLSDFGDFNTNSEGLYAGGVAAYGQWHKTFDNYQELENLPNGVYQIWVKGFYRENADYPEIPYLYANDIKTPLKKMGNIGTENAKNAAKALRDDTYLVGPITTMVTNSSLRIGVKSDTDIDWATFRQFTIHYLGPSWARGDINVDGVVDMADVPTLVRMVLGKEVKNNESDLDEDGFVTLQDVTALINLILGK